MNRIAVPLAIPFAVSLIVAAVDSSPALAQVNEDAVVQNAIVVLDQAMSMPGKAIPQAMLKDAQGVAIIPNVIKGGLIVGARHGNGVLVTRDANGQWQAPVFISLTGGNIGWQIGVQASDLVLVFKTQQSIQGILNGKFTIGADASAAAGPVGRQTAAATDGQLKAEIYTYSRSRGLFAGVSIDGSVIQLDPVANAIYYRATVPGQQPQVPPSAVRLVSEIAKFAGPATQVVPAAAVAAAPLQPMPQAEVANPAAANPATLQQQLVASSNRLYERLDPQWKTFLALPPEITHGRQPTTANLEATLAHYDKVAADPQYTKLTSTADFQQVHNALRAYTNAVKQAEAQLRLPPPPAARQPAATPQQGEPAPFNSSSHNLQVPDFQPVSLRTPSNVREPLPSGDTGGIGFSRY